VLDNTYATRKSRNEVIETAWRHGVPVRCIWLATSVADAQVNSIHRMLEAHGSLPSPEVIRELGRKDTRYLLPDAQFRYERTLETPSLDEGFVAIEHCGFARAPSASAGRAIILDFDDVVGREALCAEDVAISDGRWAVITERRSKGWSVFVHAWRPQLARRQIAMGDVDASFARLRDLLGDDVDVGCCPHDAGPPTCWCRKPIPGSVIEFARRRDIALDKSIVVGASTADRTMAERIGAHFESSDAFWPKA
jgi:histidinol phosphatase-like enzyme